MIAKAIKKITGNSGYFFMPDTDKISLRNKFEGVIENLESNELLSKLKIKTTVGTISSIITTNAVKQLELKVGSEVTAMIKTNEIIISE